MNTFGHLFRLTTFGESHGPGIGGVVDGMPAGIEIDLDFIQEELNRRRPGQSKLTTSRKEGDRVELLSGVFEGRSTGCPIGFLVRNETNILTTTTTCATRFAQVMPTTLISANTASATTVEADARRHVKPSPVVLAALWPNSC